MLSVKDMILRVRAATHDQQETGYSDMDLLMYINDGLRFARRTIMDIYPMLLVDTELEGEFMEGENEILSDRPISAIVDVRIDGERIGAINPRSIRDLRERGKPQQYYICGFSSIRVWPVPVHMHSYHVLAVGDMKPLKWDEDSPLPNEFEDFIYEYVIVRASLTNEFDMSQENNIMASVVQQISTAIRSFMPPGVKTRAYWGERRNERG